MHAEPDPLLELIPMRRQALAALKSLPLFAVLLLLGCGRGDGDAAKKSDRSIVSVAAAADLQFAFEEIISTFQEMHPEFAVRATYGSSGNFFAQLTNHAPFDLFLSADMEYPRKLSEQGLAPPGSVFQYAVGHLVLWVPRDSSLDIEKRGMTSLLDPSVRKISLANPRHAPHGRAAEAALKSGGLYNKVQERLVFGENVAQASQFVESGSADAGLISLSLALAPKMRTKGRYWQVPVQDYPRMEQGGVILSGAKNRAAAEALRDFLLGERGKAILRRFGFG
jgi:molybdate transport system substrate-binding protein